MTSMSSLQRAGVLFIKLCVLVTSEGDVWIKNRMCLSSKIFGFTSKCSLREWVPASVYKSLSTHMGEPSYEAHSCQ